MPSRFPSLDRLSYDSDYVNEPQDREHRQQLYPETPKRSLYRDPTRHLSGNSSCFSRALSSKSNGSEHPHSVDKDYLKTWFFSPSPATVSLALSHQATRESDPQHLHVV